MRSTACSRWCPFRRPRSGTGQPGEKILLYAYLNAFFETGYANPIDEAIRVYRQWDTAEYEKLDEIPYDFLRKRLSILFSVRGRAVMVTKGPLAGILEICTQAEDAAGAIREMREAVPGIRKQYESFSGEGYRVLGIACREMGVVRSVSKKDEAGMTFLGMLIFFDPPKTGVEAAVRRLRELGVSLKIITGDNRLVAASVSRRIGLMNPAVLTGPELHRMSGPALLQAAEKTDIFAEIEPNQKERIVLALKKAGHVVGYLGDGINDASALLATTLAVVVMTLLVPLTPLAGLFGFHPLPVPFLLMMGLIVLLYIGSAEWVKRAFYAKMEAGGGPHGPKK